MVANVVPSYLIDKVRNVGQPSRNRSVPHVSSTGINKRDISTFWWHIQFLLKEIGERFAILFVRLLIIIKEILIPIILSSNYYLHSKRHTIRRLMAGSKVPAKVSVSL